MRKVDALRALQEVDSALDQVRARLERIAAQWGKRQAVDAAAAARDAALAELRRRQADQRDLELAIEQLNGKLKTNSDKLYGGRVHNPRELEDLSREVDQDRRQISEREDRLIEVFEQVEAAQAAADRAAAAYAQAEATFKREQEEMAAARRELEAEGHRLTARRNQIAAQADPVSLRLYESLRRSKGGLAVVPVQQRSCQGCRIALPSSEEQKARTSTELVTCSSCGRILYAT
ncbi:MAG TPA: C4-type zinc ribbon domain-containing protein [Chloroflexota bacterium]|nr:C4-type zinc ribbon domain-containing protein [Chloroflexota bacterium]